MTDNIIKDNTCENLTTLPIVRKPWSTWLAVLISGLAGVLLLLAVITLAAPHVWITAFQLQGLNGKLCDDVAPKPSSLDTVDQKLATIEKLLRISTEKSITEGTIEANKCPSMPLAVIKDVWSGVLEASHLDDAPFGILVFYFVLVTMFSCGVLGNLSNRLVFMTFSAHALPYVGVAGTLMSFLIFAGERAAGASDIRMVFVKTLSYAAFTTIYGIVGSLIVEACLFSGGHNDSK